MYIAKDVRRILAVKVDHIGDFLTAFPALQRLKEHFPAAQLYVLASPAARQLANLEPAIDELIPFEFFHARSGLGQKEVSESDLLALKEKLAPLKFDIAIDLRKHFDTRKLLQYTGAGFTAGFEWRNQFPWLNLALNWEGDEGFIAKRTHVSDDLVNLVDAVASVGRVNREIIRKTPEWKKQQIEVIADLRKGGLYKRPVVCIHPASGTEMRQWPPENFSALIDLLIDSADINVAVIGGPDERALSEKVIAKVAGKERVISLVGRLKLAELPYFIETCALFVGNNSGPKHIAAAVGVPTVGIHSGVVDPREWGPLGEIGVAVKREMTCAPCYLARREDCHRGLACVSGLPASDVLPICQTFLALDRGIVAGA